MKLVAPGGWLLTCSCSGLVSARPLPEDRLLGVASRPDAPSRSRRARARARTIPVSLDCPEGRVLEGTLAARARARSARLRRARSRSRPGASGPRRHRAGDRACSPAELSRTGAVSYFTFSRPYPRWLDPRRFAEFPSAGAARPPCRSSTGGRRSPGRRTAAGASRARGPAALIVPWWTAFWGLPVRAVLRRLAAPAPRARARAHLPQRRGPRGDGAAPFPVARRVPRGRRVLRPLRLRRGEASSALAARTPRRGPSAPGRRGSASRPRRRAPPARDRRAARSLSRASSGSTRAWTCCSRRRRGSCGETGRARSAIVGESFPDAADVEKQLRRGGGARRDSPARRLRARGGDGRLARRPATSSCCPYRKISGSAIAARALAAAAPDGGGARSARSPRRSCPASPASSSSRATPPDSPRRRGRSSLAARGLRAGPRAPPPARTRGRATRARCARLPASRVGVRLSRPPALYCAPHGSGSHGGAASPPVLRAAVRRGARPAPGGGDRPERTLPARALRGGGGARPRRRLRPGAVRRLRDGHGLLRRS